VCQGERTPTNRSRGDRGWRSCSRGGFNHCADGASMQSPDGLEEGGALARGLGGQNCLSCDNHLDMGLREPGDVVLEVP
jgi:hypothetical protein